MLKNFNLSFAISIVIFTFIYMLIATYYKKNLTDILLEEHKISINYELDYKLEKMKALEYDFNYELSSSILNYSKLNLQSYLVNEKKLISQHENKIIISDLYKRIENKDPFVIIRKINLDNKEFDLISVIDKKTIDLKTSDYLQNLTWLVFLYFGIAFIVAYLFGKYSQYQKESKKRRTLSSNIFESSHDGIVITNKDNKIIQVNKAFTQITGYEEEDVLSKTPKIFRAKEYHPPSFYVDILDSLNKNNFWQGETTSLKKDGSKLKQELTISKILTDDKEQFYILNIVDLTQSKKDKKLIRDKQEESKKYLEIINDYLITLKVDSKGIILDVSNAFCKICGYSREELIGENHDIFRHTDTSKQFYFDMWKTIYSYKDWEGELKNQKKNGEEYYVHTKISPIVDNKNKITGYASIAVDITDKKRVEALSITDELTNTYNRRYFNVTLENEIKRAKREGKKIGFAILDVDFFKQYNDTYGHKKGDKALIAVADSLLNNASRASDYIFRLGGEEFGVLASNMNDKNFYNLIEKMRVSIEELKIEHSKNDASKFITASFGAVTFDCNDVSAKKIYKKADKLLYKAKEKGRNQTVFKPLKN